jgi:hypothetical protein
MLNAPKLCLALGLMGLAGCVSESDTPLPAVEELPQGITILQSDPNQGVLGAYRAGDDAVYFETRIGYLKPEFFREAFPEEPAHEHDMRFVDKNGLTFFLQRGGDQFVDPQWAADMDASFRTHVPDADRARAFELAQAAGIAFPKVAPPELASHTFQLRTHGARLTPAQDPRLLSRAAEIAAIKRPEVANFQEPTTWSGSGWWYLEGDMYTKSVAVFGSHGGVVLWGYDTSWKLAVVGYNHSDWSSMSYKCYSVSTCRAGESTDACQNGWRYNPSFNVEGNSSTSVVSGGCSTSYHWDGGWGYHNSNDDTAYELWQAKDGSPNTSRGNSTTFSWQAPNKLYQCNGNNGRWTAPSACP